MLDPAEPVVTAQRDYWAVFCLRPPIIAWLTSDVGRRKMIRIRHSHPEHEVAGSPADLRFVAERLKRLAAVGGEEVIVCDSEFDPKPYAAVLPKLKLIKKEGKDTVSASHDELALAGSSEGLARIASFFDMPDDAEDGYHAHYEYFPGNVFVAQDSLPLVIIVERARPNKPPQTTTGSSAPDRV